MPTQKLIQDLNHRFDIQNVLKCLWAIKNGPKDQFMAYGESWIQKIVKQKVDEGLRSSSNFKKAEVFKEAYIKHNGNMEKIAQAMELSPRTCFRYKKAYIDAETEKQIRKKKYAGSSHHLPPSGVSTPKGGGRKKLS